MLGRVNSLLGWLNSDEIRLFGGVFVFGGVIVWFGNFELGRELVVDFGLEEVFERFCIKLGVFRGDFIILDFVKFFSKSGMIEFVVNLFFGDFGRVILILGCFWEGVLLLNNFRRFWVVVLLVLVLSVIMGLNNRFWLVFGLFELVGIDGEDELVEKFTSVFVFIFDFIGLKFNKSLFWGI